MPTSAEINKRFHERIEGGGAVLMAGAANALAARIIEDQGFEAVYLSGAGLTNTHFALPDLGFVGLGDLAQATSAMRDSVSLPLVVDADTGFGNALNVYQTVRTLERAGASAIQLEDQMMPKRCGHFSGKQIVPASEMCVKVRAALDARTDPNLMIIARTDARAIEGLDGALDRARAYAEAGADITFIEAPVDAAELAAIPGAVPVPQLVNLVVGGKTPVLPFAEFDRMGFSLVLYANVALQGAIQGMVQALGALKANGKMEEGGPVIDFAERQRLVRKPQFDALEARYAE